MTIQNIQPCECCVNLHDSHSIQFDSEIKTRLISYASDVTQLSTNHQKLKPLDCLS